ncbi:MAG TPA: ATP-grasp domain-containing protein, partial [Nitrososphaeraceae archaeon]|nr:ATP-grasp domain-containing protein [Nitrososphaeraceae archaeon]
MKLLEYQGKEIFSSYGIKIPKSRLARNVYEAIEAAKEIGFPLVLKSQLTVGGRGKAGAILKCKTEEEINQKFQELMKKEVKGELPKSILLEEMEDIRKEFYLSFFLNRTKRCYSIIASSQGGVEIESVKNRIIMDVPIDGITSDLASRVANDIGLVDNEKIAFIEFIQKLSKLIYEKEAELAEINPLALLGDGTFVALDAKVILDDNA